MTNPIEAGAKLIHDWQEQAEKTRLMYSEPVLTYHELNKIAYKAALQSLHDNISDEMLAAGLKAGAGVLMPISQRYRVGLQAALKAAMEQQKEGDNG